MSLATARKGAVADARPLQNPDFRRLPNHAEQTLERAHSYECGR
jgi:hypothetical protein